MKGRGVKGLRKVKIRTIRFFWGGGGGRGQEASEVWR